jgi:hypothetical protein
LDHQIIAVEYVRKCPRNVDKQQRSEVGDRKAERNPIAPEEYYHSDESRHADGYAEKDHPDA